MEVFEVRGGYSRTEVTVSSGEHALWYGKDRGSLLKSWSFLDRITNTGPDFVQIRVGATNEPWSLLGPGESMVFQAPPYTLPFVFVRLYGVPSTVLVEGVK